MLCSFRLSRKKQQEDNKIGLTQTINPQPPDLSSIVPLIEAMPHAIWEPHRPNRSSYRVFESPSSHPGPTGTWRICLLHLSDLVHVGSVQAVYLVLIYKAPESSTHPLSLQGISSSLRKRKDNYVVIPQSETRLLRSCNCLTPPKDLVLVQNRHTPERNLGLLTNLHATCQMESSKWTYHQWVLKLGLAGSSLFPQATFALEISNHVDCTFPVPKRCSCQVAWVETLCDAQRSVEGR